METNFDKPLDKQVNANTQAIAGQTSSDANTVTVGIVQRFLYNQNTLHTPYKQGITNFTAGWIESYCASANYGFQTAYSTGDAEYMRVLNGGTWGDWRVVSGKRTSYTITSTDPDVTVNDSTKMYFVKTGSIVAVSMSIKITNAQTGFEHRKSVTMNLPPNCMPPTANNFVIDNGDVLGFTKVSLNVNGVLTIYPQTSGTTYALGVIVYATDN